MSIYVIKKINEPYIIDVGCSSGDALKWASSKLERDGYKSYTVGIDISGKVAKKAGKNLDKFVLKDVLDVDDLDGKADIVVCHRAIVYVDASVKSEIIRKCGDFLKDDGVLITENDDFQSFRTTVILRCGCVKIHTIPKT